MSRSDTDARDLRDAQDRHWHGITVCPCGNETGRPIRVDGMPFCSECAGECDRCAEPFMREDLVKSEGELLCATCKARVEAATWCGQCSNLLAWEGAPLPTKCKCCGWPTTVSRDDLGRFEGELAAVEARRRRLESAAVVVLFSVIAALAMVALLA